jgi:hypothetical protein
LKREALDRSLPSRRVKIAEESHTFAVLSTEDTVGDIKKRSYCIIIHLTRKRGEQLQGQVAMSRKVIQPSPKAKLLGVIFDQELRWKEHVQQAIKRATKVTMALSGLRHLRPGQMGQVYQACVTPVVDYVSTVWIDPLPDKTHLRHLNTIQRTALIRILSAFRTVATTTLEVEAYVLPTHLRLRH